MEPLPRGANFVRAKTLWEIGLHLAGNPATPYGGNRDMIIAVGSGSGAAFRPWLTLATGSAILAEEVAKGGGVDMAFVNPSALLTQAYRGVVPGDDFADLLRFYNDGRKQSDFESGIRLAIQAMLANPRFVFRLVQSPRGMQHRGQRRPKLGRRSRTRDQIA